VGGETVAVTARRIEDAEAVAAHGRLDVLVANAGLGDNLSALEVTEDHWDSMMNVDLKG
jgi:3-oxoacyl-[acyl-carrier protein] reductase